MRASPSGNAKAGVSQLCGAARRTHSGSAPVLRARSWGFCRSHSPRRRAGTASGPFRGLRHRQHLGFQPHRCWVTASTNAGLPVLTCATARLSAGWRSSAFSMGPSAHQPIERARPAKSGAGPNRSMPIWARLRSVPAEPDFRFRVAGQRRTRHEPELHAVRDAPVVLAPRQSRNLRNKVARGRFSATFLVQCLTAIGARALRLSEDTDRQ